MAVARDVAVEWIDRWDAQQEGYVPDREERFAVLADLVEHAVREVAEPVVVDLGCGPGSLAARIAERVPRALIVGVDADPLLVELARGRYGDLARWSVADLATDGWAATLPGPVHAAVSTTALHWMLPEQLAGLYRTVAAHTAPGGLLANGDHLAVADGLDGLAGAVAAGRARRSGVTGREGWTDWWDALLGDPRLAGLTDGRARARSAVQDAAGESEHHDGSNRLSAADHVRLLLDAGYSGAGVVWQHGDDTVVAGVR
ncbi:class I SAM-dependent methyltransferase [Pseudonocardia kongjuensis]|uniref:Class I SAM-dependent methyltransferase n=1 Tax=Pseudonocardia kongjuensis TaxID=102227 RepID=A0ABN1Y0B7_9PSEU